MTTATVESTIHSLSRTADEKAAAAAKLEAQAAAARAERDQLAAKLEEERRAAERSWAQATLDGHVAAGAAARQAVTDARSNFERVVLNTDLGKAFLNLVSAEAAVWRIDADRIDALGLTGRASSRPAKLPAVDLGIELTTVLNKHALDLIDAADRRRRQDRADAIAAKVVTR